MATSMSLSSGTASATVPNLISIKEAARLLDCCENSIYKLIRRGELEDVPVHRRRKVLASSVPDYIERHRRHGSATSLVGGR